MYDILIIGAGITGSGIAMELSKYKNLKIALLERENDVSNGTTKANSAIVHAGYDPTPGTLMAKYNVWGNEIYEDLCKRLKVPFKRVGSLVIGFNSSDMKHIHELYERGIKNGVKELYVINSEQLEELEPNVNEEAIGALYAKSAGIVGAWEIAMGMAEFAVLNGVELHLNSNVVDIKKSEDVFLVKTEKESFYSKIVINCAGIYADEIHNMIAPPTFKITPRSGQYYVMDKSQGHKINRTIFQCPTELGKGVLLTPTVHGNLLVGPDSLVSDDKEDLSTSRERLNTIREVSKKTSSKLEFREGIRTFTGLRAESDRGDFIVEESSVANFYDVGGMKSPGLTAAPAIALDFSNTLALKNSYSLKEENELKEVPPHIFFHNLSTEEKKELIEKDSSYGRIICRCEMISEGEIVAAINRPVGAKSLDGVKRRARPGAGRCQGAFCGPRVQEIISLVRNIPLTEVVQDREGSVILFGETKVGE